MLPSGYDRGLRRRWHTLVGAGVMVLFDVNERLIDRYQPDYPEVWDPSTFPWVEPLVAATPQLRDEVDRYLAEVVMPQTVEVSGLEPESDEGTFATPGLQGTWRSTVLYLMGRWLSPSEHFPTVRRALDGVGGITSAGLAGLDARSHIDDHADPNKGALRFQLPLVVPGEEGDCRIRVGDRTITWRVGEPVLFDIATRHEVWNESDDNRIVLMAEVVAPLPAPLSWLNRATQWTYRAFPSYLGMHDRVEALDRRGREDAQARP
jgi:hypothetical protein